MNTRLQACFQEINSRGVIAVAKNFGYVFASRVGVGLIALLATRLLRSALDISTLGIYATVLSVQAFALALADLGVTTSTGRLGAEFLASDEQVASAYFSMIRAWRARLVWLILALGIISTPICSLLMLGTVKQWYLFLIPLGALVPLVYLAGTYQGVMIAQQQFRSLSTWNLVQPATALAITVLLVISGQLNLVTALTLQIIATAAAYAVVIRMVPKRMVSVANPNQYLGERWVDIRRVSSTRAVISLVGALETPLNYALLTQLTSPHEAGIYFGALVVARPLSLFSEISASVLLPKASAMTGNLKALRGYVNKVVKLLPVGLLVTAIIASVLPLMVTTVLGDGFTGSLTVAWFLMGAYAPGTVLNALVLVLFPLRMEVWQMLATVGVFIIEVVLRILLIPKYGAVGVAASLFIIKIIAWIWLIWLVHIGMKRLQDEQKSSTPLGLGDRLRPTEDVQSIVD